MTAGVVGTKNILVDITCLDGVDGPIIKGLSRKTRKSSKRIAVYRESTACVKE